MLTASLDTKNCFIQAVICLLVMKTGKKNILDKFKISVSSDIILVILDYTENI